MNPLSAIQQMMPALSALPMTAKDLTAAGASAIPTGELQKVGLPEALPGVGAARAGGEPFSNVLGRLVGEVNAKQMAAGEAIHGLHSGQNVSLHQAMIAMEEASVSFQLMVEVRNKLLESYQEIMRMRV